MAKNELKEERNELARLDYSDWLSKIIEELKRESKVKLFTVKKDPNDERVRVIVDIHSFASQLAKLKAIRLPLDKSEKTYRATVNMSDNCAQVFGERIQEIKALLSQKLSERIRETFGLSLDGENCEEDIIDRLIESMLVPLSSISQQETSLFTWDFPRKTGLSSHELMWTNESETPTIRSHKVTIEINSATLFRQSVLTALENYIRQYEYDSEYPAYVISNVRAHLDSMKANSSRELDLLEKLIQEALGRLKREAEINYLEYWAKVIGEDCDNAWESGQESKLIYQFNLEGEQAARGISIDAASFYLRDYSRRFRELEKFINANKPDDYYDVTYQGFLVNIKELFSRRDAFSELPLLGQIGGCIGETDDLRRSVTALTVGLKFKFNGRVNNPVRYDSSFDYGLAIINPDSDLHNPDPTKMTTEKRKKHVEKIIKFFVGYYFAFACLNPRAENYFYDQELQFDVVGQFAEKVLPFLTKPEPESDENKKKLMRAFVKGLNEYLVPQKIKAMVFILKEYLKKEQFVLSYKNDVNIGLSRKLLQSDLGEISNTGRFFKDELHSDNIKKCLKYVSIDPQGASKDALIQFRAGLKFETDNFARTAKKGDFSMTYPTGDIQLLPAFYHFASNDENKQFVRDKRNVQVLAKLLGKEDILPENAEKASDFLSRLVFPGSAIEFKVGEVTLEKATDGGRFIYELTLRTVGFIIMELLTSRVRKNKNLFVGQWILHETREDKTTLQETLVHQMTEEWSHILSDFTWVNSQGIVMPTIDSYRLSNSRTSLYSVLPQEYRTKNKDKRTLERLLIVMVSSNKCDARSSRWGEKYISNLTGEMVAFEETETGSLKVSRVKTLAGNYWGDELHRHPEALRDAISSMYQKGFRHVLYIAQTPFAEHLRVTNQQNELFFMSPEIIKLLKAIAEDLVIYPVLYDSYSALRLDEAKNEETLYVQDVRQLSNVFNDPNRSQIVFFNLFTGKTVKGNETFYNAVTTYSTLLNAHPGDALDVNKVMDGLIKEGPLKNDIMLYLTLLHYSRYEKKHSKREQSFLKLDPLKDIIGDGAIGRSSASSRHCIPSVQINHLAFLTEVYDYLRGKRLVKNKIKSEPSTSQIQLLLLDEIEEYLDKYGVIYLNELPENYRACLGEFYDNPILKQRVELIIDPKGWFVENGVIYEIPF